MHRSGHPSGRRPAPSLWRRFALPSDPQANVTQLLQLAGEGDSRATDELLPIVYEELRRMARAQLVGDAMAVTIQPTVLVHEAYLRLVGSGDVAWSNRAHFFGAAAQAMRRILVERARHRGRLKRGGDRGRVEVDDAMLATEPEAETMLALDEALKKLEAYDPAKAQIVMLRFFTGLTNEQTAAAMGKSLTWVKEEWSYARTWLHRELDRQLKEG